MNCVVILYSSMWMCRHTMFCIVAHRRCMDMEVHKVHRFHFILAATVMEAMQQRDDSAILHIAKFHTVTLYFGKMHSTLPLIVKSHSSKLYIVRSSATPYLPFKLYGTVQVPYY